MDQQKNKIKDRTVDFFGIDAKYLVQVQKREIFDLVEYGFSYESLSKMSIEERRLYYHMLIDKFKNIQENQNKQRR